MWTIWNALRFFRVAAPSIRFVPWAALASCWPLPQQLLPVSAAGGGRRRCSGKIIYNFGIPERLRTLRYSIFTGGVWNELPQSKPDGFASSLWEGASDAPASFLIAPDTLATRLTACALSVTFGDSSPKGRANSTAESFLMMPDTLASDFKPWLPLRGKTSPAPGEDVTAGDKKGNLARERLRGRGKTLTPLP